MKIFFSVVCTFFFLNAKTQPVFIDSIITKNSLEYSIGALAHDSMKGRLTAMPETKNAANFIAARFEKAGLRPLAGNDGFFSRFPLKYQLKEETVLMHGINVFGAVKGNTSPDTVVIFCAHYDHIGLKKNIQQNDRDSVFNGANDNASGIALLIELAKYYTTLKANRYTLLFIAFSGEELGLLGSAYAAANVDQSYIHALVNIDMVGRPINSMTKNCMVIAEKSRLVIKQLNAQLDPEKKFFIPDQFPEQNLFSRSDHYSFSNVKNKIFLTASSPRDKYYHTLGDEFSTIDFDFLLSTAKKIAIACKIFIQ
jgi:Zn-dependent M28 family amino/carboxypeptidase